MSELARLIRIARTTGLINVEVIKLPLGELFEPEEFAALPVGTLISDRENDIWIKIEGDPDDLDHSGHLKEWQIVWREPKKSQGPMHRKHSTRDIVSSWIPCVVIERIPDE